MILQLLNIIAGFLLALPGLKERLAGPQELLGKIETQTTPWKDTLGLITLIAGALGLLIRLNILPSFIPEFGSSFPQAIPAILIGAILALAKLERYEMIAPHIKKLIPYSFPLGVIGIAVGLGSLLFGCIVPAFCHLPD